MEEETNDNEELGWCVLCWDLVNISTSEKQDATINKFWKQIDREDGGNCEDLLVCGECLASVAIAVEERENAEKIEVKLRSLQRQILTLLKELQGCMSGYLTEMRMIEEKIKRSQGEASLDAKKSADFGRKVKVLDAFQFRDGIVKAVKDLNLFQDQLGLKVNTAPDKNSSNLTAGTHPASTPQIKVEAEDKEEEPQNFYNDDPSYSPDSLNQVETEVDEKFGLYPTTPSVERERRSLRRSAATVAAARLSVSLRKKNRRDPKKSCSKKKTPKIKKKAASPPQKPRLPSWIKQTLIPGGPTTNRIKRRYRNRYLCELCPSFVSRYPYALEHHLREHEQEVLSKDTPKPFTCVPCNMSFSLTQHYEYHKGCHDNLFKFCCDVCNKMIAPFELVAHLKEVHGATKVFQCDNCLFCCSTRDKYFEHVKYTHTRGNIIMSCDLCPEKFNRRSTLLRHLYDVHKAIEKLECEIEGCTRTFLDPGMRRTHQYQHTKSVTCPQCDKSFPNMAALELHQSAHATERIWECTRCPKAFKSKMTLYGHEKLHDRDEATGSAPAFQCHLCEKSFLVKRTFEGHLRMHQGLGYPCDQCGLKFAGKYSLKKHMETHETEEKFFCDHCGRGFKCLSYLKGHMKAQHETPKRFECLVCQKMFRDKSNLKQHSVVHTGAKPFQCNICGKGFTQSHTLKHHKKHSHPEEKYATNDSQDI